MFRVILKRTITNEYDMTWWEKLKVEISSLWSTKPNFHRKFSNGCGLTPPVCNESLTVCSTEGQYAIINIFKSSYICNYSFTLYGNLKIENSICYSTKQVSRNRHTFFKNQNKLLSSIYLPTTYFQYFPKYATCWLTTFRKVHFLKVFFRFLH